MSNYFLLSLLVLLLTYFLHFPSPEYVNMVKQLRRKLLCIYIYIYIYIHMYASLYMYRIAMPGCLLRVYTHADAGATCTADRARDLDLPVKVYVD